MTGDFGLGVQNESGQWLTVLPRECTGHSKHPLPTTQEKTLHMDITRWSTPKSDHELLITKFRIKLKKVGKTARPFRYDLNQIPYDYTVEIYLRD